MKNRINDGLKIHVIHTAPLVKGTLVKIGALIGVVDRDSGANEGNELHMAGNFELPKIAGALSLGDVFKVDITNPLVTVHSLGSISGTVIAVGVVTRPALSTDDTADVVLS